VRHKILDSIGDFSLIGYPILGHIKAYKAGHDINSKMVQKILATPECYKLVEFSDEALKAAQAGPVPAFVGDLIPSKV
jgi:UDP-3-O-[3-hydroxymyristoyl] N-acetylglucosamine deacetylase